MDLWMKTVEKMTDLIRMEFFKFPPQAKFLALLLVLSFSGNLLGQTPVPIRALIVDGFSNHDWNQTTLAIRSILEQSGRFEVEVSTIPGDSLLRKNWKLNTTGFDLIIQNTNNIHNTALKWPKVAQESLENFVKAGGGLYILHSANNAFPDWVEYNNMIGLGWREAQDGIALEIEASTGEIIVHPAGEGKGTSHGDRFDALIQILNRHPINEGFPDAWKTKNTEVYSFPRGPAQNLTILSYAFDSTDTHSYWPVEWLVDYGKGRVYNSSMGHLWHGETFPLAYQCVGFQTTVIRAAEWLATGLVTFPVPANFPTDKESSLKPEMGLNLRKND